MALKYVVYRGKWVLRYRDPWSGKQRVRSFDDEASARQFEAVHAELYAREKELIRRARRHTSSSSASRVTVEELLARYLDTLENPATYNTTRYHIEPLTAIFGKRKAYCLTCDDVLAWCEVQRRRGVGQSTVHRRVSILRAAYNWGVRTRLLAVSPLTSLRIAKPQPQRITPPSLREARMLYDVAAPHVRRVIVLGMATGARIGPSELFRLRWSDVDTEAGVIRMPNAKKGAREASRDVPIRDDTRAEIKAWQREDARSGCAYVIAYRGNPVRSISNGWHNARRRAGITRRIRPYDLRHAFPSLALAYDADIKCVAEVMGHKNPQMLWATYQHTAFRQKRKAVNAGPGLFPSRRRRSHALWQAAVIPENRMFSLSAFCKGTPFPASFYPRPSGGDEGDFLCNCLKNKNFLLTIEALMVPFSHVIQTTYEKGRPT